METDKEDPLGPTRSVLCGLVLAAVLWTGVGLLVLTIYYFWSRS